MAWTRDHRIEMTQYLHQKQITNRESSTLRPLMWRIQTLWATDSSRTDQTNLLAKLTDNQHSTEWPEVTPWNAGYAMTYRCTGFRIKNLETGFDLTSSIQSHSSEYGHISKYDSSIKPHAHPKQIAKFQVRWQKTYHSSRRSLKTYFIVTATHHRPNFCNLRKLFMVNETAQCAIFSYLLRSKHRDSY